MRVKDIGEFGLIKRLTGALPSGNGVVKGPGDDCAVLEYKTGEYLLFTCDMLVEGEDFASGEDLFMAGRKAIAVSISDIAACGGSPAWCLVSLGLPAGAKVKDIDALYNGMKKTASKFAVSIVGGDISKAPKLTIDVSMIGTVKKERLVLRGGARPKDIIFVTGDFGGSIKGKHLSFDPRVEEASFLTGKFKPSAMIDVSDGLSQDLGHILDESGVGAVIFEDMIPLNKNASGIGDALCSGEDFELLFTLKPGPAAKLIKYSSVFKPIGEIVAREEGFSMIDGKGSRRRIEKKGFRHF